MKSIRKILNIELTEGSGLIVFIIFVRRYFAELQLSISDA